MMLKGSDTNQVLIAAAQIVIIIQTEGYGPKVENHDSACARFVEYI